MRRTSTLLLVLLTIALCMPSCVTYKDPGFYSAADMAGADHPALELRVGVRPFIIGPAGEISGKELGETAMAGKISAESERLTSAFLRDLKTLGLFARVEMAGADDDVVIEGEILKLYQDRTWAAFYVGPLLPSYYMLSLFGVPTDCADAEANVVVRAREVKTNKVIGQWQGYASRSGCAGLYYGDWPLNEALKGASSQILAGMRGDGGKLVEKVARLRAGGEPLLASDTRDKKPAAPRAVIAVFDVQDSGGKLSPKTLDQLTDYLAVKMTDVGGYRVIPRNQLRQRLRKEKSEGYKKCYDESCQIELGRAVAAEKSLATKMLQVGSKCAITATLFDLKSETTEQAASVKTDCSEDSLMEGIEKIALKLAGDN